MLMDSGVKLQITVTITELVAHGNEVGSAQNDV